MCCNNHKKITAKHLKSHWGLWSMNVFIKCLHSNNHKTSQNANLSSNKKKKIDILLLLKSLYQAREVSGRVLHKYRFCIFLWFFYWFFGPGQTECYFSPFILTNLQNPELRLNWVQSITTSKQVLRA